MGGGRHASYTWLTYMSASIRSQITELCHFGADVSATLSVYKKSQFDVATPHLDVFRTGYIRFRINQSMSYERTPSL